MSNYFDRIKKGAVTDYFSFCVPVKWLRRLVFNISDMFIMIGSFAAILLQVKKVSELDMQFLTILYVLMIVFILVGIM